MADALVWVLRFIHILAGTAWVGGAFMWSMVVAPRLLAHGPPAIRRPVLEAVIDAVPRYFMMTGGVTILFGVLLLGQLKGWENFFAVFQGTAGYPASSGAGAALGAGVVLALAMLAVGFGVIKPTSKQMLALMQSVQGPPTPEVQAKLGGLGKRMAIASISTVLMGVLALVSMTWAVNAVS